MEADWGKEEAANILRTHKKLVEERKLAEVKSRNTKFIVTKNAF